MIEVEYFEKKLHEILTLKNISSTPKTFIALMEFAYRRLKQFQPEDLDRAVEDVLFDDSRFNFALIYKAMNRARTTRVENESSENRENESRAAERFFLGQLYEGECQRQQCLGCPYLSNCRIRGREWQKGIRTIMNAGLGKKGAEELSHFMQKEFMGGIK
jgi:hypothetical protein